MQRRDDVSEKPCRVDSERGAAKEGLVEYDFNLTRKGENWKRKSDMTWQNNLRVMEYTWHRRVAHTMFPVA